MTTGAVLLALLTGCGGGSGDGGVFGEGALAEAGQMSASTSEDWWLSSGALFLRDGGRGTTVQGELPPDSPWRELYARSKPVDSEGGLRPQNVFRLVRRESLGDGAVEVRFLVNRTNRTASPHRNGSNGVFLFLRYQSENDLYAAGFRVDGQAVVKKKIRGRNVTLGIRPVYGDPGNYDRNANANLLPQGRPVGVRAEARNAAGGEVMIRLSVLDPSLGSGWTPLLEVADRSVGGPPHGPGFTGLRSDFMDVEFDGYRVSGP